MCPRLILLSTFYDPYLSGAEQCVKAIAERLCGQYEIVIITGRFKRSLSVFERRESYLIRRIGIGSRHDKWLFCFLAPIVAIGLHPRIIHAVMESYAGIALAFVRFFAPSIPTVLTLQSGDLDEKADKKQIPLWFWKLIHRAPHVVTAISNALAERAKRLGARSVTVIPNGVDMAVARSAARNKEQGATNNKLRIICVARFSTEKGVEYAIRAMPIILKQVPDAQLVLVGDGPLRASLEGLVRELGVAPSVEFKGRIAHGEVLREIASSSVLVGPSLGEGQGIVFVEGQAVGVPVVGTNVGGIPDVIEHGATGLLVPPRDPQAIAQAVFEIVSKPELTTKMVNEASRRIAQFDWQRITESYVRVYREACAARILIATGIYPPDVGGPAQYVQRVASHLSAQGSRVRIITYGSTPPYPRHSEGSPPSTVILSLSKDPVGGTEPMNVTTIPRGNSFFVRYFSYCIAVMLRGFSSDIIFLQDPISAGLPTRLANLIVRRPLVLKIVGDHAWEQAQARYGITAGLDEFLKRRFGWKIELWKKLQSWVTRGADRVIVPSEYLKSIVAQWGIGVQKIEAIPNGVELNPVLKPIDRWPAPRVILSVGRLVPWKGFEELIEAYGIIAKDNSDVHCVIIGDGPLKGVLVRQIESQGLNGRVTLMGPRSKEEVAWALRQCALFVLNSSYEGLSHVLLEALAAGAAIVATEIPANREVIRDSENGLLVPVGNGEILRSAILRILNDDHLRAELGAYALKSSVRFRSEDMCKATEELLRGQV